MENKEVLRLIYDLDTGNPSTYKIEQNKIRIVKDYIEQLEKENTELKKRLEAKDKALDKACEQLEMYKTYEFDDLQTKEDYKEWCENETTN